MKNLAIGFFLILLLGCKDDPIKKSYGDWKDTIATVIQVDLEQDGDFVDLIQFGDKKGHIISDYQLGQTVRIKYREIWTTYCENGRCELLSTIYEVQYE